MAKLNLQVRNCEVKEDLQEHFEKMLDSLDRLSSQDNEAMVKISSQRGRFGAEITLVSGDMITRGEDRADNIRMAFDNAIDKLEGQLRRYKKKVVARARRHDNRDDVAGEVLHAKLPGAGLAHDGVSPNANYNGHAESNGNGHHDDETDHVVRVKRFALKPMSAEEASLQMGLLGHNFFVFRDAQSDQVSVVYRRRDGGYGLIEPVSD